MTHALAPTGIWSGHLRYGDRAQAADAAAELEALGYGALWIPDVGGDLFPAIENLLGSTTTATIATGILNLWMHEPADVAARYHQLTTVYGDRLVLGIGVSHAPLIDAKEAGRYRQPLATTRRYLEQLDEQAPTVPTDRRLLAALGPKMLELSATLANGTHPYNVTPEHTAIARAALGPDRIVAPEQAVILETDPERARRIARAFLTTYCALPNYANNWYRIGFSPDDALDGGSDALIDALIAWGDEDAIAARVQAHRDAGADHVCIQVLTESGELPLPEWRRLAPVLVS